jgi:DNA-binding HxlR family transcriptional regulator
MRFKVFISSVQREFAAERQMLAEYVRKDALLGKFFEVFLFEEEPACDVEARDLYLPEVERSDVYLGILGSQFGNADADGVSPTEREYNLATAKALDWAGYVERSGHCTEFIIEKCEAQGLATPQYKPDAAIFHTIIWRKTVERAVAQSNGPVAHQVAYAVAYQVAYQNVSSNTAGRIFLILGDGPLGRADIAKAIGVTRMARSLKLALNTLMEDGLIEYTIPDNVRSRLQKYRLTEKGRQMLVQKGNTHS